MSEQPPRFDPAKYKETMREQWQSIDPVIYRETMREQWQSTAEGWHRLDSGAKSVGRGRDGIDA